MITICPFKALRPQDHLAKQLASRPYDVLNTEEARKEAKDNPYSFLHITRSEIDLPVTSDVHSSEVYEKAKDNLYRFISENVLFHEEKPCYYIYELEMNGKTQTGLVCLSSVEDYFGDRIKKHEFTRPEKEKDRIDHMMAIGAHTGNVFLAYRDVDEINELIKNWKAEHPTLYSFTANDDISHRIWVIDEDDTVKQIGKIFADQVPSTYIADGHHRAASAAKVSQQLPGVEGAKYFLTTIFPASELAIFDYNRMVKDLNGLTAESLVKKLESQFEIRKVDSAFAPPRPHEFGLYMDSQWYQLLAKERTYSDDPIGALDVTILSTNVLDKILGIKDQRTDKRIDFVGGIRGLGELERRVNSGEMALAFSLHPVSIAQLFEIADSGNVMPPKSTWFEPKLRDGLLTNTFR